MSAQAKSISLQQKLVKTSVTSSIVAGVIAFVLLMAMTIYQTMHVHDEIMDEISDMLVISDLSSSSAQQMDELSDEFDVEYQLKLNHQLLTQSPEFDANYRNIKPLYVSKKNYGYVWMNGQLMRTYNFEEDNQHVRLYQPFRERFKEVLQSILGYAVILLILWLVQWLILRIAVKKQFQSIHTLSKEISNKSAHDLTPIQQQQPELQELQPMVLQLNHLLSRLEHSLEAEQRFTADASHELRSPLSAIQMRLQLLKRKYGQSVPTLATDMNQIQTDVARGTQVLENLLLLARLDPSHMRELAHHAFDLQNIIEDVQKALLLFAQEKQVEFEIDTVSSVINANQELIFTCIRNLVDNAIRYTQVAGRIRIKLKQSEQFAVLCIENSGQGVSEEVLQRMGERFYRQLGTKTQGSGLGISICKKIIDLHKGKIEFAQSEWGGLKVELTLPL